MYVTDKCVPQSIPSSRLLFNTAMANTNRCNPNAMNPADRRRGGGKGKVKEGVPVPPPLPGAVPEPTHRPTSLILVS